MIDTTQSERCNTKSQTIVYVDEKDFTYNLTSADKREGLPHCFLPKLIIETQRLDYGILVKKRRSLGANIAALRLWW